MFTPKMQRLEDAERLRQYERHKHVHGPQTVEGRTHNLWLSSLNSERVIRNENSPSRFSMLWSPSVQLPMSGVNAMALYTISVPKEMLVQTGTKLGQRVKAVVKLHMFLVQFLLFLLQKAHQLVQLDYAALQDQALANLIYSLRGFFNALEELTVDPEDHAPEKMTLGTIDRLKGLALKQVLATHRGKEESDGMVELHELKDPAVQQAWLNLGSLRLCLLHLKGVEAYNAQPREFIVTDIQTTPSPLLHVHERRSLPKLDLMTRAVTKYTNFLSVFDKGLFAKFLVVERAVNKTGWPQEEGEDREDEGKDYKATFKTTLKLGPQVTSFAIDGSIEFFELLNVKLGYLRVSERSLMLHAPRRFQFSLTPQTMADHLFENLKYVSHLVVECEQLQQDVFFFHNRAILAVVPVVMSPEDYEDVQQHDYYNYEIPNPRFVPFDRRAFTKLEFAIKDLYGNEVKGLSRPHYRNESSAATVMSISVREGL